MLGDCTISAKIKEGDGVLLDCNMFTIRHLRTVYSDLIKRVIDSNPIWVQINDCARSKLHLNYKTYGAKSKSQEDYIQLYNDWGSILGWGVIAYEGHARATQIVLGKI